MYGQKLTNGLINRETIHRLILADKLRMNSTLRVITFDQDIFYGKLTFCRSDRIQLRLDDGSIKAINISNAQSIKLI
ncbi:MAG: hypothetical protein IPM96_16010 [Ignavibacteria bacterium]|nr:hypothetical protein [Ignavibacteria bacterium]